MVLGYLLYEAVDLGVNVVKLTYNGVRGTYYWWYREDYPEVAQEKRKIEDIEKLIAKVERLENILEQKQIDKTLTDK
jgi:hypothetical protein|tara:strand:+ start:263 stop:493 length:231 start_codon:yes stop_codon:yes gene_type:complete